MEEIKVFCSNCKYYNPCDYTDGSCCKSLGTKNTFLKVEHIYGDLSKLNKNNDCEHFIKKKCYPSYLLEPEVIVLILNLIFVITLVILIYCR